MAVKSIVFDIGGVLADFNVNGFLSGKGFDAPMIKRILKASVMTPYWGQFERGEISEEETLQGFASVVGRQDMIAVLQQPFHQSEQFDVVFHNQYT